MKIKGAEFNLNLNKLASDFINNGDLVYPEWDSAFYCEIIEASKDSFFILKPTLESSTNAIKFHFRASVDPKTGLRTSNTLQMYTNSTIRRNLKIDHLTQDMYWLCTQTVTGNIIVHIGQNTIPTNSNRLKTPHIAVNIKNANRALEENELFEVL